MLSHASAPAGPDYHFLTTPFKVAAATKAAPRLSSSPTTIQVLFTTSSWDQAPVTPSTPVPLAPSIVTTEREFKGDAMRGFATATYVMTQLSTGDDGDPSGVFTGTLVFEGTILGRKGAVALHTRGSYDGDSVEARWTIVSESASGELEGITGHGSYAIADATASRDSGVEVEGELVLSFD
ncbi:hypothetical protein Q8F55_002835 [Vanrija albida]|uniref:Dirigent protein n=1 Tax=Vanrija albida TaxID=181172 RepID=A0ABR3QAZ5_9TREE